jgi:hypothetical protein
LSVALGVGDVLAEADVDPALVDADSTDVFEGAPPPLPHAASSRAAAVAAAARVL